MQRDIALVAADPARATIYAEGWQSCSVTAAVPAAAAPPQVTTRDCLTAECQRGAAAPVGIHQGSGLLAVDPGDGGPVEIFAAVTAERGVPVVQARACDGYLMVSADGPVTHRTDMGAGGLTGALARWSTEFAERAGVPAGRLRVVPPVWCPWHQYAAETTEDDIVANLAAMDALELAVGVVQIGEGYQAAPGDWLLPSGRFADLPRLAARVRAAGRRPGLWIAPMLVGRSSELLRRHPGWVVRGGAGEPVYAGTVGGEECTALDVTHPGAAGYLRSVFGGLRDWGFDYFTLDGGYAGACEGARHEDVAGVVAYRRALRLIRESIGPGPFLAGCGAPILASVGLVDAMRVGPGIASSFEPADGNPSSPSQRAASRNAVARAWQHGRFWVNDTGCLMARPGVERREDWAALVERFGGLRSSGDGLSLLDAWGLEATRKLLVPSPVGPVVLARGLQAA